MGKFLRRQSLLLLFIGYTLIARAQDKENKIQLSADAGYQVENFHWSIAGNINGQSPNVYSELKWKNIAGWGYHFNLHWNVWNRLSLIGDYTRTATTAGSSNDTDYGANNRNDPVYDQNFNSNKGNTSAWYAGVGYAILKTRVWDVSPYIGYTGNDQSYYLLGSDGSFGQLNTSYKAQWRGPFLKILSDLKLNNRFKIVADLTYNQVTYNAAADWNLIESFEHPVSFRHNADGYGLDVGVKLVFKIDRHFSINLAANYFNWETGNGTDQLYLTTGETDKTQLNGATRNGYRIGLGLIAGF